MSRRASPFLILLLVQMGFRVPAAGAGPRSKGTAGTIPHAELETVLENARNYLRTRQNADGSFGGPQPHLQTALASLALLATGPELIEEDRARIQKAVAALVADGSSPGDLGDEAFRTESHALALTALLCAWAHIEDRALRERASMTIYRALRMLERWQDRSSSSASRGGWKMEGRKGRQNDRRASAWAILAYRTARLYGLPVKEANLERSLGFLLASFKKESDKADQVGGLSVDAEGLSVASISSMGGWALECWRPGTEEALLNQLWLERHPPVWSGPNYFYTNFFRIRAMHRAGPRGGLFRRTWRQLFFQIREHQSASGAVAFPPGNAQNTVAMGPVFSTSLAALILSAPQSALLFDQDFRVWPLF